MSNEENLDRAAEHAEHFLQVSLLNRKPSGPVANGFCHYCSSPTAPGLRWCDALCRDDYEKEQRR